MTISVEGKLLEIVCKNAAVNAFRTSSFRTSRCFPAPCPTPVNHLPAPLPELAVDVDEEIDPARFKERPRTADFDASRA